MSSVKNLENRLVGFGKYSSLTYKELANTQKNYVCWLFRQEWFSTKYPELHDYLDYQGLKPSDISGFQFGFSLANNNREMETENPSKPLNHNQIQALYIDNERVYDLANDVLGDNYEYDLINKTFEDISETDIVFEFERKEKKSFLGFSKKEKIYLLVEIKTSMSSDYPEVLRQMRKQKRSFEVHYEPQCEVKQVLLIQNYCGRDVSLNDVKQIFGDISIEEL